MICNIELKIIAKDFADKNLTHYICYPFRIINKKKFKV